MIPSLKLPTPGLYGKKSVEEVISARRSVRRFKAESLTLEQLSQLLWSAQGITDGTHRAIPSAGATFPLEVYAVVGEQTVENLSAAIYHYIPDGHSLNVYLEGDFRGNLSTQNAIAICPVDLVVCAVFSRTTLRYGNRGERYVHMEAGHLGQNVALQAVGLGLATVMVGAFNDDNVCSLFNFEDTSRPLYIIPVGKPA
jgi:SagB-type dehydrogenase family enzyme